MKLSSRLLLLPAMISLLMACGEESNNLANPITDDSKTTTTCQNKDYCLSGQFIDEPVVGLNYQCNNVEGVTNEEGIFTCPSNSVVSFFLQSDTKKRKIHLGQYRIRAIGDGDGAPVKTLIAVTPKDLIASVSEDYPNSLDSEGATQVTNILRLLQALDSDGHGVNLATNRIVIDSNDKKHIDELVADVAVNDFAFSETIEKLLKPMFDKMGEKTFAGIAPAQAIERFSTSLNSINSGVYEVIPTSINKLNYDGSLTYSGMLGKWSASDLHSMVSMFFVVDREGKTIGNALEWQKSLTSEQLNNALLIRDVLLSVSPTPLDFLGTDMGFSNNGKVSPNFVLKGESGRIELTQGTLLKGAIASSERFYRTVYGLIETDEVDSKKLGLWRRVSNDNSVQLSAGFNLQKNRTINLFLDPSIWRVSDNVAVGEKPIFPLHLKMTLRDGDKSSICGGKEGNGCLLGDMGITILENGNIITDRDNDCSIVDASSLIDQGDGGDNHAVTEHRLGMISTVLREDSTNKATPVIAPIILVGSWARTLSSDDPWFKFYGIYSGMPSGFSGGTKVQIDISRILDKIVTIQHQKDDQEKFGVQPLWTNYAKFMQYFSLNDAEKLNMEGQLQGRITNIQTQACYNPQPKI